MNEKRNLCSVPNEADVILQLSTWEMCFSIRLNIEVAVMMLDVLSNVDARWLALDSI